LYESASPSAADIVRTCRIGRFVPKPETARATECHAHAAARAHDRALVRLGGGGLEWRTREGVSFFGAAEAIGLLLS
jgi:hypothetical protein